MQQPSKARCLDGSVGVVSASFKWARTLNPSFFGGCLEPTGTVNSAVGNQFSFTGPGSVPTACSSTPPNMGGFSSTIGYIMKPDNGGNAKYDPERDPTQTALWLLSVVQQDQRHEGTTWLWVLRMTSAWPRLLARSRTTVVLRGLHHQCNRSSRRAFALTLDIARENGDGMKNTDFLVEARTPCRAKRTFAYAAY